MNKEVINERETQQEQISIALKVLLSGSSLDESNEALTSVLELFHKDPWYLNIFSIWFRKSPEDILKIFSTPSVPIQQQ